MPSIEAGSSGPGRLRSTFSISSINLSSGAKRRLRRSRLVASATTATASTTITAKVIGQA